MIYLKSTLDLGIVPASKGVNSGNTWCKGVDPVLAFYYERLAEGGSEWPNDEYSESSTKKRQNSPSSYRES